jgi:hypothetical protein
MLLTFFSLFIQIFNVIFANIELNNLIIFGTKFSTIKKLVKNLLATRKKIFFPQKKTKFFQFYILKRTNIKLFIIFVDCL